MFVLIFLQPLNAVLVFLSLFASSETAYVKISITVYYSCCCSGAFVVILAIPFINIVLGKSLSKIA